MGGERERVSLSSCPSPPSLLTTKSACSEAAIRNYIHYQRAGGIDLLFCFHAVLSETGYRCLLHVFWCEIKYGFLCVSDILVRTNVSLIDSATVSNTG